MPGNLDFTHQHVSSDIVEATDVHTPINPSGGATGPTGAAGATGPTGAVGPTGAGATGVATFVGPTGTAAEIAAALIAAGLMASS
jgi:hypothetical protein